MNASPAARVVVTGGASGIGAAIVRRFAAAGSKVAVLDRDKRALEAIADSPEILLDVDVTDPDAVNQAFSVLDDAWGGVDVLCNSAGISSRQSFLTTTLDTWQSTLDVNLTGVFLVAQAAAHRMLATGSGVIVNIASVSGMVGMPGYSAYNSSKAGVIELTKTMALELAPTVRVNSICPGYVLTPMQRAEYTAEMIADCAATIPAGRLGTPEEIALLVTYLASPGAAFITGQSIVIDGGESAGGLSSHMFRSDEKK
jgi:meso-butanediol dehydrogenase/(S,S)-butanediol dehydrogenase/diacetyl reductase